MPSLVVLWPDRCMVRLYVQQYGTVICWCPACGAGTINFQRMLGVMLLSGAAYCALGHGELLPLEGNQQHSTARTATCVPSSPHTVMW
jgi:hypothetical protein